MENAYDPSAIEPAWQKRWEEAKLFNIDLKDTKKEDAFYSLVMFPYPSGDKLHIGHWYNFAPADSYARFMRLKGKTVFEPMGFDSFGLPAENYAIKTGTPPAESIATNVTTMIDQLKKIGSMYDWSKTLNSSDPSYYKWTQWLFTEMFKHDLAYKKEASVNWCPKDQTVLANEQVKDGLCDRCGSEVVQKPLKQWFWSITKYADKLLNNLDDLDWPEKTKTMQRNWIGRSEGAEIEFSIENSESSIKVFTTRPDTLFGVTYLVLAPEHELVDQIVPKDHQGVVNAYRDDVQKKTELERTDLNKTKSGVHTGAYALHPATGERLPIWIADYVLMNYGTGAVMAVPAHDERDFEFATLYDLPKIEVVTGGNIDTEVFTGDGKIINSEFLDGLSVADAKKKAIAWLEDAEKGRGLINYRLRDWSIGRQRYWGAPIPIVYDPEGKPHAIPQEHLPWQLPTDVEFEPSGVAPLAKSAELKERTEKIFGEGWRPEYDTMDTFVCSSFYYLRFLANGDDSKLIDPHVEKIWMPVDMYIGGAEHACMHLLYARFVMMALKDFGVVSNEEPFRRLVHQGLITKDGAKMSKSKGNVVSPDSFVEQYGSDVFRMYLMFMGPFTDGGDWSDSGIKGIVRFVQRAWTMFTTKVEDAADEAAVVTQLHKAIKMVTESYEKLQFNVAIANLMELLNLIEKQGKVSKETAQAFAILIAPIAPHLADALHEKLGGKGFVIDQKWPSFDPAKLVSDTMVIAVQVNGKLRASIEVPSDADKESVLAAAKDNPNVQKFITDQTIKKEIYVPQKIVNLVI